MPSLSSSATLGPGQSNQTLAMKDRHDSKQSNGTVQIIKRPEDAFTKIPERKRRSRMRDTISTWGF